MRRTLVGRIRIFLLPTDDALNKRGGNNRRIYRAEAFSSTYRAHAKLLFFIIVSSSSRYTLVALPPFPSFHTDSIMFIIYSENLSPRLVKILSTDNRL